MVEKQFQTNMFSNFFLQKVAIISEDLIVIGVVGGATENVCKY